MEDKFHKTAYCEKIGLINIEVFSERVKLVLTLRTQIKSRFELAYQDLGNFVHFYFSWCSFSCVTRNLVLTLKMFKRFQYACHDL